MRCEDTMMLMRTLLVAMILSTLLAAQSHGPTPAGYDVELWTKAWRLHHESVVVDTHSDTTSLILDRGFDMGKRSESGHMDLPRIFEGGLDVQFYSIYVSRNYFGDEDMSGRDQLAGSKPNASARRALDMMDGFFTTVANNQDRMMACFSVADIDKALAEGKHAALMGIEGGHAIEGDLRLLRMFHRLGIRYITLTHGNHNHFADSSGEAVPRWGGLNQLGVKVVKEMNRLGVMVDVSHVSDATFYDALNVTRAPVVLSHSSARKLCKHVRNITDDMLVALAKNGGVIMINYNCGFLDDGYGRRRNAWSARTGMLRQAIRKKHAAGSEERKRAIAAMHTKYPPPQPPELKVLIDHILHVIQVAGADHVGLGSDFDGVPCVPKGIDDVTYLPHITYRLLKRGVEPRVVRKVLGQNLLRVFKQVESVSLDLHREKPYMNDPKTDRQKINGR